MRYKEILHEYIIKVNDVSIFRNPIKPVVLNIFKDASKSVHDHHVTGISPDAYDPQAKLRGIIAGDKIYVWNSWNGMHFDIVQGMVREGFINDDERRSYSGFYLVTNKKQITHYGFYTAGMTKYSTEAHRELLDKHIDRWNS